MTANHDNEDQGLRRAEDMASVAAYLVWAETEGEIAGGRTATQALEAFCRLQGVTPEKIRAVILGI